MRKGLTGLLLGVGVALIVGLVVVGVVAAQTPTPATPGGFHGAVLAKAAAILGVSEAKLSDALIQAHSQALDDAVKAGYLTQAQADWMKQHHQSMPRNGGPGLMGGYGKMGHGMMGGGMMGGRFGGGYGPGYGPPAAQPSR